MMKVLVLTMGGTIDSSPYSEKEGEYPAHATPTGDSLAIRALRDIAAQSSPPVHIDHIAICGKDSKSLDDKDRESLRLNVKDHAAHYGRIIATMGTDRMTETARELRIKVIEALSCPVVFTGSIWPLANGDKSDARDNLRLALFHQAVPDVYIAMNGLFKPCTDIEKDFKQKKFVERLRA